MADATNRRQHRVTQRQAAAAATLVDNPQSQFAPQQPVQFDTYQQPTAYAQQQQQQQQQEPGGFFGGASSDVSNVWPSHAIGATSQSRTLLESYAPPTARSLTLVPAAAAAFRAEQSAPYPAIAPLAAPAGAGQQLSAQHHRPPMQPAVFEESIATGAFRRIGVADLAAKSKSWRVGSEVSGRTGVDGNKASSAPATAEELERLDPQSFVSPRLLSTVRTLHRFAQSLLVGILLGVSVLVSQYTDDNSLLSAWAVHADWARVSMFVLGVFSWLGAIEQFAAYRRAAMPTLQSARLRASGRAVIAACCAYSLLLATVYATMPSDQRLTAQAASLKTGSVPSSQLISDIGAWKALLALRLVCALVGWFAVEWNVHGPQEVDNLLQQRQPVHQPRSSASDGAVDSRGGGAIGVDAAGLGQQEASSSSIAV